MIDHFGINCTDYARSQQFYDRMRGVPPRLWPEYHEGYFGAFVRDPGDNNVEAVCHA